MWSSTDIPWYNGDRVTHTIAQINRSKWGLKHQDDNIHVLLSIGVLQLDNNPKPLKLVFATLP